MLRWSQPTKFPGWFQKVLSRGRDASSPGRNFKKHHIIPADSAAATLPRWRVYLKAPTYFVYPRTRSAARCITRWTRSMCSRPATDSRPGSVTIAQLYCAISVGWMCQTRASRPCSDSDSLDLRRYTHTPCSPRKKKGCSPIAGGCAEEIVGEHKDKNAQTGVRVQKPLLLSASHRFQ